MALRGENVGTAYVRILADGSGLSRSIKDQLRDHDDDFAAAGKNNSQAYKDAFDKELNEGPNRNSIRQSLYKAMRRPELAKEFFDKDPAWAEFRRRSEKEWGDIGAIAVRNMEDEFRHGRIDFSGLIGKMDRFLPEIEKATKQIMAEETKFFSDREMAYVENQKRINIEVGRAWAEAHAEQKRRNDADLHQRMDYDRDFEAMLQRHRDMVSAYAENERRDEATRTKALKFRQLLEKAYAENELRTRRRGILLDQAYVENVRRNNLSLKNSYTDLMLLVERMVKGQEENDLRFRTGAGRKALIADLRAMGSRMETMGLRTAEVTDRLGDNERALRRLSPRLDAYTRSAVKMSDTVGKAFGKGSRNNFINAIGGIAGAIAGLPAMLGRAGQGFVRYRARLQEAAAAGKLGITLFKDMGAVVGGLGGLLGGAFLLVGPLASILSMLGGVVTALAGSIGMGLAGGLGALAGTLFPFAAAVGGLALAFTNLTAEQKKSLQPTKEAFKEWGRVANSGLFDRLGDQMKELGPIMESLNPVIRKISTQLGRQFELAFKGLNRGGASGAFGQFRASLERFLPDATKRLGDTMRHTLGSMMGVFRALIPITRRFIGWIDEGSTKFSHWANSLKGQNAMKKFFQEAGDSASELGDFLGAVSKLLGTLVRQGAGAGDTLFGDMTKAVDGWNKALRENPDILNKWFEDAVKFGRALGNMVEGVSRLFAALDSETSRSLATAALQSLANILRVVSGLLQPIASLLDGLSSNFKSFAGQVAAAAFILPRFTGAIESAKTKAAGMVGSLKDTETRMQAVGRAARAAAGIGGMLLLDQSMRSTNSSMQILGSAAGGALTGFSVGGPWGAAIGGAAGLMGGLAYATQQSAQAFRDSIKFNEDYAASFDQVTGAITRATKEATFRNLQNDGSLTVSRMIGIPDRQAIAAAMGNVKALKGITDRVRGLTGGKHPFFNKDSAADFINGFRYMGKELTAQQKKFLQMVNATRDLKGALKGIPKNVKTKIEAMSLNPTVKGVEKLRDRYKLTPKQVSTVVKALGIEKAWNDHKRVIDKAKELDKQRPKPKVDADTKAANDKLAAAAAKLRALDFEVAHPKVDVQWSAAAGALTEIQRRVNALYGKTIVIRTQHVDQRLGNIKTASGGVFEGMRGIGMQRIIGEAGPEAVVPLNRPLSMVDPAVRALSAIAQGKGIPKMASGGVVGGGKSIDASGWQIVSNSKDPEAVAAEVVNRLVAASY